MSNVEAIKKAFQNMFRPLKWHHFAGPTDYGTGEWFAHGTNKSYQIFDVRSKYPDDLPFYAKELSCQFETLEEAQEAVRTRDEQDIFQRLDPDFLTTLEALQRENERLREALKPFCTEAENWHDMWPDDHIPALHAKGNVCSSCGIEPDCDVAKFTVGDLRRARTALASAGEEHHADK